VAGFEPTASSSRTSRGQLGEARRPAVWCVERHAAPLTDRGIAVLLCCTGALSVLPLGVGEGRVGRPGRRPRGRSCHRSFGSSAHGGDASGRRGRRGTPGGPTARRRLPRAYTAAGGAAGVARASVRREDSLVRTAVWVSTPS
jgi:hypothetical protein